MPIMRAAWIVSAGIALGGAAACTEEPSGSGPGGPPEEELGHVAPKWHEPGRHSGPHILTCYGGCAAPHYDPSACGGGTACCSACIDGTWWYSTEQRNFGCGAKLEIRRGDRCVVVEVADNGPATWVEDRAAATCGGTGWIIDASPLVADYFGGGCGWSECFSVDVREVPRSLPQGICPSCPCDGPPAHPVFELRAEIADIAGQDRDFCRLYSSDGKFDMSVGQATVQRFYVANAGTAIGRNAIVGIWVEEPYLRVTRWDIYDNWPGHSCGAEWCLNDSNDHPENPAHDNPGGAFLLHLYGLSPGETKMIEMRVEAGAYSIGLADHPDVRAWVKHVDDYYEKNDFWSTDYNNVGGYQTWNGGDLRIWSETDVLAPEACNGFDDDCDGETDEDCGEGLPDSGSDADGRADGWADGPGDGLALDVPPYDGSRPMDGGQDADPGDGCGCVAAGARGPTSGGPVLPIALLLAAVAALRPRRLAPHRIDPQAPARTLPRPPTDAASTGEGCSRRR